MLQEEVLRFEDIENVKVDLVATKGIAYLKFRTASSALRAKEDIEKHNVVSFQQGTHVCVNVVWPVQRVSATMLRIWATQIFSHSTLLVESACARRADRRQARRGACGRAQDTPGLLHTNRLPLGQPPRQRLWQCTFVTA